MPGTGNLTIDGSGWKGPISVPLGKRIHLAHALPLRLEWCVLPSASAAPAATLVGSPLLGDTQRIQNGIQTGFGFDANVYVRLEPGAATAELPVVLPYHILD